MSYQFNEIFTDINVGVGISTILLSGDIINEQQHKKKQIMIITTDKQNIPMVIIIIIKTETDIVNRPRVRLIIILYRYVLSPN